MVHKKSRRTSKKGGECKRDCTIRPGCSGNRFYNPKSQKCEFDFQGIGKMYGGAKGSHANFAVRQILQNNPMLIPLRKNMIPLNINSKKDWENYDLFLSNALDSKDKQETINNGIKALYMGGKRKSSIKRTKRTKKNKKNSKRRYH